eukprot:6096549-Pleurochrysis_carterae.AAC.1
MSTPQRSLAASYAPKLVRDNRTSRPPPQGWWAGETQTESMPAGCDIVHARWKVRGHIAARP